MAKARNILLVATADDVEYIGSHSILDQDQFPHFNCRNLDIGIFGQIFWELSRNERDFSKRSESGRTVYSASRGSETIVLHTLPSHVADRYARLSDTDLSELAAR